MTLVDKLRHILELAAVEKESCQGHSHECRCFENLKTNIGIELNVYDSKKRKATK